MLLVEMECKTMSLFINAAWGQDTDRAPIWMMRQAGRYLPEYRAIKERSNFWEMCRTPELACEITLQPVKRLGVDAAILFQDIMTPLPAMGVDIHLFSWFVIKENNYLQRCLSVAAAYKIRFSRF